MFARLEVGRILAWPNRSPSTDAMIWRSWMSRGSLRVMVMRADSIPGYPRRLWSAAAGCSLPWSTQ